jgi:glutamate dehydrogenase (NAD(P)+)
MITVREALKDMGIPIEQTKASIQGFGMVGRHAAQLYSQMGGKVVCVACWNHDDHTAYAFIIKKGWILDD